MLLNGGGSAALSRDSSATIDKEAGFMACFTKTTPTSKDCNVECGCYNSLSLVAKTFSTTGKNSMNT
jgi:hypothetical protein